MNRCKSVLYILLFLLSASTAVAQSPADVLRRARTALALERGVETSFTSKTYVKGSRDVFVTLGTLKVLGDRFHLNFGQITAAYTAPLLSYYDGDEHTLTLSHPTAEELTQINPLGFVGDSKNYRITFEKKSNVTPTLRFTPVKPGTLSYLIIAFSAQTGLPNQVQVFAKDGSRIDIAIQKILPLSAPVSADFFRLNAKDYPEAEIVDLR